MRPLLLAAAAAALTAVAAVGLPAAAATTIVGYLPPGIDYGTPTRADDDSGEPTADLKPGQIRAQAVVVDQLEPGRASLDTEQVCPASGCAYALVLLDATALQATAAAASQPQASGCGSLDWATIDDAPDSQPLGGARLYTAQGSLPDTTTPPPAANARPRPVGAGLGHLCLVARSGADRLTNDDGDGPLAATQPKPVVVFGANPVSWTPEQLGQGILSL